MITFKKILKCPYKEPPVLIMDMQVHISERWFLYDLLPKLYGRTTLSRDFRGEREKNKYLIALQGKEKK